MSHAIDPDAAAVLATWFGSATLDEPVPPALQRRWFASDPAFDRELAARFGELILAASANRLFAWEETPREALALVILLDQFTRNVYRDSARAFVADPIARGIVDRALARGHDRALPWMTRSFFYLPFEHAEELAVQDRAVALFHALAADAPPELAGNAADLSKYAESHRAVIARFGRFPHRNAVLGRESTPDEVEFLRSGRGF